MRNTWVLDTETKGTGAEMVPLEKLEKKLASKGVRPVMAPKAKPRPAPPASPREPWRFKVTDVMTRQALAEDADLRATLGVLQDARSVVDVRIYVWETEAEDWQALTFDQKMLLWKYRGVGERPENAAAPRSEAA